MTELACCVEFSQEMLALDPDTAWHCCVLCSSHYFEGTLRDGLLEVEEGSWGPRCLTQKYLLSKFTFYLQDGR